jgi:hypothetical protein
MMFLSKRKNAIWYVFGLYLIINCQTANAQSAPEWVTDFRKIYPESDWICVVESARNRQQAQAAASTALAGVFKVDVKSLTTASQNFSKTVSGGESQLSQNEGFGRQVSTTSDITGLMGILTDFWTDSKNDTVYACSRMNKRESTATYSAIIKENDNVIATLKKEAAEHPATFDAYESLSIAANLATMTDNYLNILSVLNSSARQALRVSYGNTATVEVLKQQASRSIVIALTVNGDVNGRIAKAFGEVFSSYGFRTRSGSGDNPYALEVEFQLEDMDLKTGGNSFVRYELNAAILDSNGVEIFPFSANSRHSHRSASEARQRAIRSAEDAVTGAGFATAFDEYLTSLLK